MFSDVFFCQHNRTIVVFPFDQNFFLFDKYGSNVFSGSNTFYTLMETEAYSFYKCVFKRKFEGEQKSLAIHRTVELLSILFSEHEFRETLNNQQLTEINRNGFSTELHFEYLDVVFF